MVRRVSAADLGRWKRRGRRIPVLTCYDFTMARILDQVGVPVLLVGDSLGQVMLGHGSTLPVTLDDMVRHTAAVTRGASHALVVADMPFMSFQASVSDALRSAGRLMAEGGAKAVKLEGGRAVVETVAKMTEAGIPVMGHLGLTPQSVHQMGGYRLQAKDAAAATALLDDCRALQDAGAFAVVLECIPAELAVIASGELDIPTIGIGAGVGCDGEVQVFHDLLGLGGDFVPKHAGRYADIGQEIRAAVAKYADDVREGVFPGEAQSSHMDAQVLEELRAARSGSVRRLAGGE